jgi:hypothetical protein
MQKDNDIHLITTFRISVSVNEHNDDIAEAAKNRNKLKPHLLEEENTTL